MIDIAMMVAGVGMQFFNNYANNKKNEELQAKQREFQRAAAEQDFERMRKLQAESAKIALELEEELHKERMNDINNQYDCVLDNFAHSFTISNWPLKVLPFIMKGESFGGLIHGSARTINMHCIFTPSNCEWFNSNFYDDIDLRLEAEMNNNWNAQSSHPIVYYGGAWNRQYGEASTINLNDIDLLRINLRGIPTMIITPYFDPWLHFRVEIWGMGKDATEHFRIDIPHGDVEFDSRIFSYDYNKNEKSNIDDNDFQNYTINEFVPYLESLIGFVADKYFWSMYKTLPLLPHLIDNDTNNVIKENVISSYNTEIEQLINNLKEASLTYNEFSMYLEGLTPILPENIITQYKSSVKIYSELVSDSDNLLKVSEFIEISSNKCDVLEIIVKYEEYIERNLTLISFEPTLVIENTEYRTLCIYIEDELTNKYFDLSESFAYKIRFQQMVRDKNTRLLFNRYANMGVLKINKYNIDKVKELLTKLTY